MAKTDLNLPAGYINYFYGDWVARNPGLINVTALKYKLLMQQMRKFQARAKESVVTQGGASEEAWKSVDTMLNMSAEELTKIFFGSMENAAEQATQRITVQTTGGEFGLGQQARLKEVFADVQNLTSNFAAFANSLEQALQQASVLFSDPKVMASMQQAVFAHLSGQAKMQGFQGTELYQEILKEIFKHHGNFVKPTTINGIPLSVPMQKMLMLAHALRTAPEAIITGTMTDKRVEGRKFLELMIEKNAGWVGNLVGKTGELAFEMAASKANIEINEALMKVEAAFAGGDLTTDIKLDPHIQSDLAKLKEAFPTGTTAKEDVTVYYNMNEARIVIGFSVKSSTRKSKNLMRRSSVKLQDESTLMNALVTSGLYSNRQFMREFSMTGAGHSTSERVAAMGKYKPAMHYTSGAIDARWRQLTSVIAMGMVLNALSGYGGRADAALFFVYNNRVISMRQILEQIYKTFMGSAEIPTIVQMTNINRSPFKEVNSFVGNVRNMKEAKERSNKANQDLTSLFYSTRLRFDLKFTAGMF